MLVSALPQKNNKNSVKEVNLLSRAEMKNVIGGIIDGDTLYEVCLSWATSLANFDPTSDEYYIIRRLYEVDSAEFTIAIP